MKYSGDFLREKLALTRIIYSIAILDTNTKIYFRTPSVRVTKDWVNRLRCVINYVNAQQEDMSAAKPAGTKPWMVSLH